MTNALGEHAIVVGAGIAGLTAAAVLADAFEKVTLLERDTLPDGPAPRTGTPHCRQAHTLLQGGSNVLTGLFPEFETELERAGAVRARASLDILLETPGFDPWPQRDFGFDTFCMTRPLVESVVRRLVERKGGVQLLSRCRANALQCSKHNNSVSGVRYETEDGQSTTLDADLVVDASSRGILTLDLLDHLGLPRPAEMEIGIDVGYATALFERPNDKARDWLGVIHRPAAQSGRGAFLFPVENNLWQLSLGGMHGDTPPDDFEGFLAFAKSLRTPTIYNAIKDTTPVGVIYRFVFPSSIRRKFDALEQFPERLLTIGDAVCRFNPTYGQGMTVAVQESGVLKRLLDERRGSAQPLDSVAPAFFAGIQTVLAAPWSIAESDFMYAKTRGECPADLQQRFKFGGALQRVAVGDAAVHRLVTEVNHLLRPPSALRDPLIVEKVTAVMAAS
jgi:2-polyprenyl-6-methoxyphenol hydroxylase-like FAD-dependent oxidoreductase